MERSLTPAVERMQALAAGELVLEPLVAGHAELMIEVLKEPQLQWLGFHEAGAQEAPLHALADAERLLVK